MPSLEPENLLAEIVGKAFLPFGLTSEKTFVEDLVKSLPVAYLLVAGSLIDQRDDADMRQAAREMKRGQELNAAGFDVDANRVFQT